MAAELPPPAAPGAEAPAAPAPPAAPLVAAAAPVPSAAWPTALLALGLAAPKVVQWGLPEADWDRVGEYLTDLATSTHEDLLFALGSGAAFQAAAWAARRRPGLARALDRLLLAWGAACVAFAVASVQIFASLRSPLTYPLLYLAGDLASMRSSLDAFVDWRLVAGVLLAPAAYLVAVAAARRLRPWPAAPGRLALVALAAGLLGLVGFGWATAEGRWSDRSDRLIARSPHLAFLGSCLEELTGQHAESMDVPYGPEDLKDFELPAARTRQARRPLPGKPPTNVILLVLESTGTRYLQAYGSRYRTTPNLVAESRHLLAFDAFYSHVGLTSNAMAAITLSVFPYMTWREYTVEYPRLPGKTLAQLFKAEGRRTAFLHTGDLDYVNQRGFLEGRGFDVLWDFRDLGAAERLSSWGGEDRHLVDSLFRFVDQAKGKPFYVMAWTIQSHHPYDPSPDRPLVDFFGADLPPDDYDLGRYLNTLLEADRQLGRLFAGLRERNLADDTLVVITGDHGEAFGSPHQTWGHGFRLYDEGIKVPLLVWSPRLIKKGRHLPTVGSHVDLNPTVADLAGLAGDASWHGRSMFDPGRPPRAYFYAANDDYLLGVREDQFKYVYNLTAGREELYDLAADPDEQVNVAPLHPLKCQRLRQRVAAWREHEARHMEQLRAATPPAPPDRE
ncbi:MAG: sulfatase-like hydrolase/transferase [Anaeromyxobacter sp.]|nr:sulfatase-like hydrolase/transferase [Anaeromyxobacter sp.]MBL0277438.1 sulfatase-like hydrolase/transferase [Anaeromyxobacter sp.]